jgi:DNA-binding transcriptional LysR family regulator
MAKAAAELNISQPAVSKAMGELEHAVGAKLVDRSRQGIEPTPRGRALLRRGSIIFDELRQGVAELEFLSDPTAGEVRIGGSSATIVGIISAVIDRLSRQHPRMSFHVVTPGPAMHYHTA